MDGGIALVTGNLSREKIQEIATKRYLHASIALPLDGTITCKDSRD